MKYSGNFTRSDGTTICFSGVTVNLGETALMHYALSESNRYFRNASERYFELPNGRVSIEPIGDTDKEGKFAVTARASDNLEASGIIENFIRTTSAAECDAPFDEVAKCFANEIRRGNSQ